jgi:hypothetical protein
MPGRARMVGLGVLAAVNLAAGLWLSTQPSHAEDLHAVAGWVREWLSGANPYASIHSVVDYPPWALVALSPLSLVPSAWLTPLWAGVNLALLAALIVRLVRRVDEPDRARLALALLLAATASSRTLTQFSLLSFLLAVTGGFSASRVLGGVCVGLSLMKPQVGGVVLCWWLLQREWARAGIAAGVAAALAVVFAVRAGIGPALLVQQYASVLTVVHGASEPLPGHTEFRAWLLPFWPEHAAALGTSAVLALLFLAPAVVAVSRARPSRFAGDGSLELLALCGCASLLAVRHLSYDFLLLWPALLAWRRSPAAFFTLSALLVAQLPGWVRLAAAHGFPAPILVLTEIDRYLAFGAWIVLSWRVAFASRRAA